ncbi:MAG: hopanoid biosynthesis-associated protein HpnK [Deltaproteobacteria bacterium]|nr:hopanoid biosynthesis-associated protein HpnK [Deltaproteobacteria bacterium]
MTSLIVTADDFGLNRSVNRAVEEAAQSGILTSASLMLTGRAVDDAISIAGSMPSLDVGLHLSLTEGTPVSLPHTVPDLVKKNGHFYDSPAMQGILLQFKRDIAAQVKKEVSAQFRAFADTGLPFVHIDSHHHLHVHPKLFDIVMENAAMYKLHTVRIPYEPWNISGQICPEHRIRNMFYSMVFSPLCSVCRRKAELTGLRSSDAVFGLYRTGQITERWILKLIDLISEQNGVFELYSHPCDTSNSSGMEELKALVSPEVRKRICDRGIKLIRYSDL